MRLNLHKEGYGLVLVLRKMSLTLDRRKAICELTAKGGIIRSTRKQLILWPFKLEAEVVNDV